MFGNLDYKYTTDGLHLNKMGYCVLKEILEEALGEIKMFFCVDCRVDENLENDFLNLNLCGKPVVFYVIQELVKIKTCSEIYILTNSEKVKTMCKGMKIISQIPNEYPLFFISGRAAFLKCTTIENAISEYKHGIYYSATNCRDIAFDNIESTISFLDCERNKPVNAFLITDGTTENVNMFMLNQTESLVINRRNDFELALILKRKENNQIILKQSILDRIEEKKNVFQDKSNKNGICLVGHSQIDNWTVSLLGNYPVRNCGIRGISSFEFTDYILKSELLSCMEDIYVLMHGTNDIVYDYSFTQIAESINSTIQYIKKRRPTSRVYFLQCIHVNGRLDRNNKYIDSLNAYLKNCLQDITWICTDAFDDEFKNLKAEYTIDGLHLSERGYELLQQILEKEII